VAYDIETIGGVAHYDAGDDDADVHQPSIPDGRSLLQHPRKSGRG
jgi:hypothetical protein